LFPAAAPCDASGCSGWSVEALNEVSDVLLRFDLVESVHQHLTDDDTK